MLSWPDYSDLVNGFGSCAYKDGTKQRYNLEHPPDLGYKVMIINYKIKIKMTSSKRR